MPTAQSNSQCPYCDHVSPAGSKFCNECGAALHLRPCPHCGSVNDISASPHCSRCNGELGFATTAEASEASDAHIASPTAAPVATQAPILHEVIELTRAGPAPATFTAAPLKPARSYAPLIAFAVIAVAAVGFFGLRSAPEIEPSKAMAMRAPQSKPLIAADTPATETPATSANTAAPEAPAVAAELGGAAASESVSNTSAPATQRDAAPSPAFAASLARLSPTGAGRTINARRESAAPPAGAAAAPAEGGYSAGQRARPPGEGLELKPPNLGTCTDAVAALGLCSKDSNPRSP